jgi:transcriptional regulator with XRE-family HTH domain
MVLHITGLLAIFKYSTPPFMIKGETIRKLRLLKGFSQQQVAKKLSISQPAYCKKEKNEFLTGKSLENILRAIGCTMAEVEKINGFSLLPEK